MSEDIRKHLSWLDEEERRDVKNAVDVFYNIIHLPKERYKVFNRKYKEIYSKPE